MKKGGYFLDTRKKNEDKKKNDKMLISEIQKTLDEKMNDQAFDINVSSKNRNVHLTGYVENIYEKKQAEEVIQNIDGVRFVENNLTISTDGEYSDKDMETEIRDHLRNTKNSDKLLGVGVDVTNGSAYLVGNVDTLEDAYNAMKIASEGRGVKHVVNNLKINTADKYDDITISNSIQQLYNIEDITDREINTRVDDGVVTISGYVPTRQEVEIAKELAMGIDGVKRVINKLKLHKNN